MFSKQTINVYLATEDLFRTIVLILVVLIVRFDR